MRVNIAYSVELEEVPKLTKKLLGDATKNLEILFKKYKTISHELEKENETKALQVMDECRRLMAAADASLGDCHSILGGYQRTLFQLQDEGASNDVLEDG